MRHLLLLAVLFISCHARAADPAPDQPLIQVAILLDDSGSMEGLISQARANLWTVVGKLSTLRRGSRVPRLQVALYHYGDAPYLSAPLIGLSNDLDEVSRLLFSVNSGGGEERCGEVIANAVKQLAWSQRPQDLRLILIAGNEPFTQGPVDWRLAVGTALGKGITINTIHCGPTADGVAGGWEAAARSGEGRYLCIDQNVVATAVTAPQDDELRRLNAALNGTYLPYGARGADGAGNQRDQDNNAVLSGGSISSRVAAKASKAYQNRSWDLVDATADGSVDQAALRDDALPPALRGLTPAQRQERIATAAAERARIQADIARLVAERARFVVAEEAKAAKGAAGQTWGDAAAAAIAEQAARAGFTAAETR